MEFEGIRISFSDAEVRDYMLAYPELQFPEDLRKAERVVSRRLPRGSDAEVLRALEGELNNLALKNRQLAKQVHSAATSKASRVPAQDHDCFVRDGRLHVANGFEASLLEEFADGDRDRLRLELDRIGQFLPYRANGEQLKLAVRSQLAKQKSWEIKDGKPKGRAAAADDIAHMAKLAEESAKQSQQQKGRRS